MDVIAFVGADCNKGKAGMVEAVLAVQQILPFLALLAGPERGQQPGGVQTGRGGQTGAFKGALEIIYHQLKPGVISQVVLAVKAHQEGRGGAGAVPDAGKDVRVVAQRQSVPVNFTHTLADPPGDDWQVLPEIRGKRAGGGHGRGFHVIGCRNGSGGWDSRGRQPGGSRPCRILVGLSDWSDGLAASRQQAKQETAQVCSCL